MFHFSGMGSRSMGAVTWCENPPPNQCIKPSEYNQVMAKVKEQCAYKKVSQQVRGLLGVRGLGVMCSAYAFRSNVMLSNLDQYDPCYVEGLPPCMPEDPSVPTRAGDPPATEEGDDDNKMFMVGGILAMCLIAGGSYAVLKSRKKKKKGGKK